MNNFKEYKKIRKHKVFLKRHLNMGESYLQNLYNLEKFFNWKNYKERSRLSLFIFMNFVYYCISVVQRGFIMIYPYMHIMYFDKKFNPFNTLSYFPFKVNFNWFHCSIFIHSWKILHSYSPTLITFSIWTSSSHWWSLPQIPFLHSSFFFFRESKYKMIVQFSKTKIRPEIKV